ncbi:hypothetical protein FI667_g15491, partial [Globisporangium splendens]
MQNRVSAVESVVSKLQDQVSRVDGKRRQLQDSVDRRFDHAQDSFSKLALSLHEAQAELGILKSANDQFMTREREAAHLLQTSQSSQEQAMEWLQKLRQDCSQVQTDLFTFKEEMNCTCVALASDVQAIAKECTSIRGSASQSNAQLLGKLETLREAMDRQAKMDRNQTSQRLDVLTESLATYELRSKDAFTTLLKNHSRIHTTLDEGMSICSSEIETLSHELKHHQSDQHEKLDAVMTQLTTSSIEWIRKYEELESSIRAIAMP